jgi:hypothetical protein
VPVDRVLAANKAPLPSLPLARVCPSGLNAAELTE